MIEQVHRGVWRDRDRVLGADLAAAGPDDGTRRDGAIRPEIRNSWRRCVMTGITPDTDDIPYLPDLPEDSRLLRAAAPVVTQLAGQLAHSPATILLADSTARIVDRRAGSHSLLAKLDRANVAPGFAYSEESTGTNGIGTALEERRLFAVQGGEHYRESLQTLACVGTPIVHPIERRVEGILDITCGITDANDMMAPLVTAAVREIEQRLYEMASRDERALLEDFLRTSRHGSAAVVTMSSDLVMANPAATRLIQPADHALLWNWACLRLGTAEEFTGEVQLADSTAVTARARRLGDGRRTVGIALELRPACVREASRPGRRARAAAPPRPAGRTAAGTLSGRGHASRLLDREIDLIAGQPGPTLVTGAPGTGKRYTARCMHARWATGGAIGETDLALLDQAEATAALREAAAALAAGTTVVLRNSDAADDTTMTRVVGLVEQAGAHDWPLIVTGPDEPGGNAGRAYVHLRRRLSVVPLSQRIEELEDIARAILKENGGTASPPRLQAAVLQALSRRSWPGNVRELESVLCSAAARAMGGDIGLQHLPAGYRDSAPSRARTTLERAELDTLLTVMEECGGNKSMAAERLGVARSTLYRKVREYGIDTDRFVTR